MKVLVALDANDAKQRIIGYCGKQLAIASDGDSCKLEVVLLLVEQFPDFSNFVNEEGFVDICEQERKKQQAFLQESKQLLVNFGVPAECIREEYVENEGCKLMEYADVRLHIAKTILKTLSSGGYDTLVMGKRCVSKAHAYLFGSVTKQVLEKAKDCVVWLVC